ncbi:MAG: DsrE family protein [Candidatus Paceibacterota bacterium]
MSNKLMVVLLSDTSTHENMGRALHALLYAKQAKDAGMDVKLIFDGGGVEWAAKLADKEHQMHELYKELLDSGVIEGVCAFCSEAFEVETKLKETEVSFVDEDEGHPNVGKRIANDWQILII